MIKIEYEKLGKSEIKKTGYKYRLLKTYTIRLSRYVKAIDTGFIKISKCGLMTITAGYCWDGPSGPSLDTKTFMRGSLVHDAFYQLIRDRLILYDKKQYADILLKQICLEDGMTKIRAWYVYQAVKVFGHYACIK